jgi:hypothetical protein
MHTREEMMRHLRRESLELNRRLEALRRSAELAQGGVKQYRLLRVSHLAEKQRQLSERIDLLEKRGLKAWHRAWADAEMLWSDLRDAVLSAGFTPGRA